GEPTAVANADASGSAAQRVGRSIVEKSPPALSDRFGDQLPAGAIARLGSVRFRLPNSYMKIFSPDCKTLAVAAEDGIHLRDLATGRTVRKLAVPQQIQSMVFSPDGRTLGSEESGRIRVWDIFSERELHQFQAGSDARLRMMTPDGKTLVSGYSQERA